MTDNTLLNKTKICILEITRQERESRQTSFHISYYDYPPYKSRENILHNSKDIIIQNLFKTQQWHKRKKQTNLFEKVNSYPNGIITLKTASRAFFKIVEMSQFIYDFLSQDKPLSFLSIAEAPGGFIQGLQHVRETHADPNVRRWSIFDYFIGNTIESDGNNPDWSDIIKHDIRNALFYGDITKPETVSTITHYALKSGDNTTYVDFCSADCGVDVSNNYREQEIIMYPLCIAQIKLAVKFLKPGGVFIIKLFDTDTYHMKELIYLLTCLFKTVIIHKPRTSRPLNSERYLICRNFSLLHMDMRDKIVKLLDQYNTRIYKQKGLLWKKPISEEFIHLINGYNAYCKEITKRHLSFVMKDIHHNTIRTQHKIAVDIAKEFNLPVFKNHP